MVMLWKAKTSYNEIHIKHNRNKPDIKAGAGDAEGWLRAGHEQKSEGNITTKQANTRRSLRRCWCGNLLESNTMQEVTAPLLYPTTSWIKRRNRKKTRTVQNLVSFPHNVRESAQAPHQ